MAVRMRDREFFDADGCWSDMELCASGRLLNYGGEPGECQGLGNAERSGSELQLYIDVVSINVSKKHKDT